MSIQAKEEDLLLRVRNIGVSYSLKGRRPWGNRFWALNDISFDLYRGEALGIIGRNGVGKSTLLRVIAGIMSPDRGTLAMYAQRVALLSLQIGFVDYLTGRENAIISGMLQGMRRKQIVDSLHEIEDFAELGSFFEQQLATYSTGMRSRLGFSVALQLDPEIMLVDEVTSVGDAAFQVKSFEAMRGLVASNRSIIVVSHAAYVIQKLCNRVVWIEHGEVVKEGLVDDVLPEYQKTIPKRSA